MELVFLVSTLLSLFNAVRKCFNKLKKATVKAQRLKSQKNFLKQCFEERIVPKSLIPNRLQSSTNLPFTDNAGIYKVGCSDCSDVYIGESDNISRRIQQHKYDRVNLNNNNPIVKHIINNNHTINFNNTEVIKKVSNVKQRKLLESLFIQNSNNMNVYSNSINFDICTSNIIKNNCKQLRKIIDNINPG